MKEGYVIRDQTAIYFFTITVVDWIDVFTRRTYKEVIIDSFDYCVNNKGMLMYSYVIMSNHIHFIVQSKEGKLSDLIRDFKKYTATRILKLIKSEPESRREWMLERFSLAAEQHTRNKNYQFWQYGNHAIEIYSEKFMWSKLDYIHLNPVRAGLVEYSSNYVYSSASNYSTGKGVFPKIEIIENPIIDISKNSSFEKYRCNE